MKPILQAHHLVKHYGAGRGRVAAVRDVSLEAHPGEVVLIMGPSGSGKTTLLSLLGGLLSADSGNIFYGNQEMTALQRSQLTKLRAQYVGFVFQSFNLIPTLNTWENVAVVPQLLGVNRAAARQRSFALLDELGLKARAHHAINQLSGGEQQRVSIARALVAEPQLILADEPTANLDSKNGHAVAQILHDIARKTQRAVIVVSHDERIKDLADRVLVLEDGKLQ